jgi:ABC-2 type transport system permease protein
MSDVADSSPSPHAHHRAGHRHHRHHDEHRRTGSAARTLATSRRALRQLRHDPRTIGLMVVVPVLIMGLLAWILSGQDTGPVSGFDRYGPMYLGIFPMVIMFLVTSIATLRERTRGTLERLLTMPLAKPNFVFGYAIAFGGFAVLQALVVSAFCFGIFGMETRGPAWQVVLVAVVDALLGTALGLFVSAFAATEFQAVQFMPVILIPQFLLAGVIVPRDQLPTALEWLSNLLPMSYAVDATQQVMLHAEATPEFWRDIVVVGIWVVVALSLGAATLRRRTS